MRSVLRGATVSQSERALLAARTVRFAGARLGRRAGWISSDYSEYAGAGAPTWRRGARLGMKGVMSMAHLRRRRPSLLLACAGLALTAALGACGDDKGGTEAT